jgi:hypothetical protein
MVFRIRIRIDLRLLETDPQRNTNPDAVIKCAKISTFYTNSGSGSALRPVWIRNTDFNFINVF